MNKSYPDYGKVSIIMPTYNSADYVAESINSIIAQSYENWELLITDDHSSDNTIQVLSTLAEKDSRIKIFQMPKNVGAGVARNKSILEANGRFIAFCDSDDIWKPEKLSVQLDFMISNDVKICYSSYIECDENGGGGWKESDTIVAPHKVTYSDMLRNDYIGFLTLIYDTSVIGKVLMPPLRKRQDWGMKILLLQKMPIAYGLVTPLAYYRVRHDSLSRNKYHLVKYNVKVYESVLHCGKIKAWLMFLFLFMPHYLLKKVRQKLLIRIY